MTKQVRRRLFYSLTALFLVMGSGVVLYAQGWRVDFKTLTAGKIGGMYIRSYPPDAHIALDGRSVKGGGFFTTGTFVGNLFPKRYLLELTAEGHKPLRQTIDVRPSLVAELKYAVLIPARPREVRNGVRELAAIVGREPLTASATGTLIYRGVALKGNMFVGATAGASRILSRDAKTGTYFLTDTRSGATQNISAILENADSAAARALRRSEASLIVLPEETRRLLMVRPYSVSLLDIPRSTREVLAEATSSREFGAVGVTRRLILWNVRARDAATSTLVVYDVARGITTQSSHTIPEKTKKIEFGNDTLAGVLQENGDLFLYRPYEDRLTKLASDVRDFVFTDDASRIAALERSSVEIFTPAEPNEYWRFNLPDVGLVTALAWYRDRSHLFVHYPHEVRFLDLNDAGLEHFGVVANAAHAAYDDSSNVFYFIRENTLFALDFPS